MIWSEDEVNALETGLTRYGAHWSLILQDKELAPRFVVGRTQIQLKDKAAVEREKRERHARRYGLNEGDVVGVWAKACLRKRCTQRAVAETVSAAEVAS